MTIEEFGSWAKSRGYQWLGSNAYGVHRGFPFSVYLKTGKVSALTASFRVQKGMKGKALRALRRSLPKGCSILAPTAGRLDLVTAGPDEVLAEHFRAALDQTAQAMAEAGLTAPDKCPYCHQGGCDALSAIGGGPQKTNYGALAGGAVGVAVAQATTQATGYVPVHRACVTEQASSAAAQAEVNTVTGSYFTGFLGAVLGGMVGALPSVACYFLGYYVALFYALIPLAAYQGYRICRGKMNRGAFWFTLLSSVFQLFFIEQAIFFIYLTMELGYMPYLWDSVSFYFSIMEPGEILVDMLPSLLFLLLGIWFAWSKIRRTSAHEVQDMTTAVETLSSYTPIAPGDRPW